MGDIVKRILRTLSKPIINVLMNYRIRYSGYLSVFNSVFSLNQKEKFFKNAMEFIKNTNIKGDYLEFGVFQGKTFAYAYHLAQFYKLEDMKFYAFDSFKGLPEPKGIDIDYDLFCEGDFACSADDFKKIIIKKGVDINKVEIIEGFYKERLNNDLKKKLCIEKAAFVNIDCDLYESTYLVLDFVKSYLSSGTIVSFDAWYIYKGSVNKGEQKALSEFLAKNPDIKFHQYHKYGYCSNSFIVERRR